MATSDDGGAQSVEFYNGNPFKRVKAMLPVLSQLLDTVVKCRTMQQAPNPWADLDRYFSYTQNLSEHVTLFIFCLSLSLAKK